MSEVVRVGAAGAGVAYCPSSNGRLASGLCPVRDLLDAGAPVGLGVDGVASNEGGELLPELKQALFFARLRSGQPDALTPSQALELVQEEGILAVPGSGFGRSGYMRLSLTISSPEIDRSLPGFERAVRKMQAA